MDLSGAAVGGELVGGGEIGAGEHRQPYRIAAPRQGFGLPQHRHHFAGAEAVVVGGVGGEAFCCHLDGPVASGAGAERTAVNE